jgi:hypothetical protein
MTNWTPEAVKAEMNYRIEVARRHDAVRRVRDARGRRHWWSWREPTQQQHTLAA